MWANQKAQDAGLENAFGLLDPDERTFEGNALIPGPAAVCPGCCANCSSKKETPLDALAKVVHLKCYISDSNFREVPMVFVGYLDICDVLGI